VVKYGFGAPGLQADVTNAPGEGKFTNTGLKTNQCNGKKNKSARRRPWPLQRQEKTLAFIHWL
jgi:hypothetical protein